MLCGAAIGAQIGTVATKYSKGFGIRIAFGIAVVCCMISVILKQFAWNISAAVVILSAISAISLYICWVMFSGAAKELRDKRMREKFPA
jgi:membrane protein implicated in regulation of membrane protease activity